MNLNVSNPFTIRIIPRRAVGSLHVSMTAVPNGTKMVFAAPLNSWEDYAFQLRNVIGIRSEAIEEATERLQVGTSAKVTGDCFITSMKEMGFELVQR